MIKDHFTLFQAHIYTTDKTDYKLKSIQEIVKLIDDEYEARRKPGNLAYQRMENQVMTVTASSNKYCSRSSAGRETALWHVTDGIIESPFPDLNEQCFSDSTPNQVPDWIELNFHNPVSAGKVVVYPKKNSLRDYEVQVSNDGKEWTTVGKVENATDAAQVVSFNRQLLKCIRIFVTKTNGPNTLISEIEVYEK